MVLAALFLSTGIIYSQEPPMRRLTTHNAHDYSPSWSPDGRKITFNLERSGNPDIWVMDADGGNERRLTTNEAIDWHPSWSPDGQKIAFMSERSGNLDIWVMDVDGGHKRQLTTHNANDYSPSWSPDGRKIAFSSYRRGSSNIWVMDADGGNERRLTNSIDRDHSPSWSPDGRKIAFISPWRISKGKIGVVDADGGNIRRLTTNVTSDGNLSWSPDGQKIAFGSERSGNGDIWVMDTDGGNQRQLTTHEARDEDPSWSPDGRKIAFCSERSGNRDIWVLDVPAALQPSTSIASREPAATLIPPVKLRTAVLNTAIVEFQEKGSLDIEDAGEIVAEWMSSSLLKTGAFTLYERVLLYKILEEQDLGLTGALDEKTTAEIGKLYGVEAIVTGTVSKFGNTISVVAKLIDTETAKVLASSDVKTTSVDEIPGAIDRLARELAKEP